MHQNYGAKWHFHSRKSFNTGCHFSICVYDKELNTAIYGDSLGWPAPGKLIQKINCYVKGFFGEPENILHRECHNSNSNRQKSHVCKNDRCVIYPLQKDGDICGIIYIVVASIVCLAPRFWEYIWVTKCLDRKCNPCQYLSEPTKFHRYLRTVVMICNDSKIDIEMIVNNRWILSYINKSIISSSDQEKDENEKVGEKNQLTLEETIKKETVAIDKNNFKCSECGEIFSRKSNLKRHFD